MEALAIQSTYCLVSHLRPRARPPANPRIIVIDLNIEDYVFSDRAHVSETRASWTPVLRWQALTGDWKQTYCNNKAQAAEPQLETLIQRRNATKDFQLAKLAWRHGSAVADVIAAAKIRAKKRRKGQRIQSNEKLGESSSDASPDSSSEGGTLPSNLRVSFCLIFYTAKLHQNTPIYVQKSSPPTLCP
jgi:hypothetical protein